MIAAIWPSVCKLSLKDRDLWMFPETGGSSYISHQRTYTSCSNKGFDSCFVWTTLRDPEQGVQDFWKLPCLEAAFFTTHVQDVSLKKLLKSLSLPGQGLWDIMLEN